MKIVQHPLFLSLLSGMLFSLSWPTVGFPFLLFFAFIPLFILEKNIREHTFHFPKLTLFSCSYFAFLIWNVTTTGWLYYASVFGMLFAVLVNSLLMALLFLIYQKVAKKVTQNWAFLFFVTLWISFEKLHLEWDFSWPWLNIGNSFSEYYRLIQWYEYTGTFGGTLWILIGNISLFKIVTHYQNANFFDIRRISCFLGLLLIPILFSIYIYYNYTSEGKLKEVLIIQPNINPYTEKYGQLNTSIVSSILDQTEQLITTKTDYVITPETVLAEHTDLADFAYSNEHLLLHNYIYKYPNVSFLLGIDAYNLWRNESHTNPASNKVRDGLWVNYYNAALYVDSNFVTQKHIKSKLVVGVENLPYKTFLEPLLSGFMIDLGGTLSSRTTQEKPSVFKSKNETIVAPVICYESVYGEYVNQYVQDGANFLAIMTNDAWWNETQGHKQHLSYARLRAIETRRDIARSANTGISAFINQKGDIHQQTKYNEKTALIGKVQLNNQKTFYVQHGDYIARISFYVMSLVLLVSITKRRSILG